jgi:hypothetical protein
VALHTACWRGYICHYGVRSGHLQLLHLTVGMESPFAPEAGAGPAPPVFGSEPATDEGAATYRPTNAVVPFTGGLLLGDGFIEELYVHMGFHPAWKFERVVELIFEDGRLVRSHDRSAQLAEIRHRIQAGEMGDPDRPGELLAWIPRTFELDYGRSFP